MISIHSVETVVRLLGRQTKVAEAQGVPHLLRLNGSTAGVLTSRKDGRELTVCVFQSGAPWRKGDYILLRSRSGQESRYRLTRLDTPRDPGDQHFLWLEFAPAQGPEARSLWARLKAVLSFRR